MRQTYPGQMDNLDRALTRYHSMNFQQDAASHAQAKVDNTNYDIQKPSTKENIET